MAAGISCLLWISLAISRTTLEYSVNIHHRRTTPTVVKSDVDTLDEADSRRDALFEMTVRC